MVFPPVHFMQWSYGLESSFPSFPPAASILNSIVTSLRRLFVTAPHTHTTKSLLLAPSGSTSLTDTMATFPCGFRAGATSALFAALSHRVLGTQQVLNMYFLNKSTIQWSNRTCDQQRKQKSSQNYPHTLTHILISPQKSFKKGHNTVSFVSEQSSMYMEDGNERWMEKRRLGRQAGSLRDQVKDKEGLIQVTISMMDKRTESYLRDVRCELNGTWWQACKWRGRHREECVTSSLLTGAIQWAVPLLTEKEMGGREQSLKHELYLEHVELDVPIGLPRRSQWHPTPVLLPGKSHGQRSLVGCSPRGS